jgi:hypothetical protein
MSARTVSEVAAEFRPRYEQAARDDEELGTDLHRRAELKAWDEALATATPDPVEADDFDAVVARTFALWQRLPQGRRTR